MNLLIRWIELIEIISPRTRIYFRKVDSYIHLSGYFCKVSAYKLHIVTPSALSMEFQKRGTIFVVMSRETTAPISCSVDFG